MKKSNSAFGIQKIKNIIKNFASFLVSTTFIYDAINRLTQLISFESWSTHKILYILFFLPMILLTTLSVFLFIEGQIFHLINETRCSIDSLQSIDSYCSSYFGLMIGIQIAALFQLYLFWYFLTSLRTHLFKK